MWCFTFKFEKAYGKSFSHYIDGIYRYKAYSRLHKLRTKELSPVKVLWSNQLERDTWEVVDNMKRYPHLFEPEEVPNKGTNSFLSTFQIEMMC